jgi:hypothetical protein
VTARIRAAHSMKSFRGHFVSILGGTAWTSRPTLSTQHHSVVVSISTKTHHVLLLLLFLEKTSREDMCVIDIVFGRREDPQSHTTYSAWFLESAVRSAETEKGRKKSRGSLYTRKWVLYT